MDKLKRKQYMFSVLKTLAYFVGFPLMMVAVLIGSNQFMHYDLFDNTWYLALVICAIPWILASILQISFGCFVKNQNIKTLVVALVVVIVMVGSGLVIDGYGSSAVKDVQKTYSAQKYVDAGVVVNDYKYQVNWYVTKTDEDSLLDKFKDRLDLFTTIYHIVKVNGECFSEEENTDGSPVKANATEKGLGLTNVSISPNGLLADGWIFSAKNAVDIMIAYHELNSKATALGIDLEADYKDIIAKVEESPEYTAYMETAEYQAAYGENGTAYNHMINEDRINEMLPVVAKYLALALTDVANIMGNVSYGLITGYIDLDAMGQLNDLDELVAYVNNAIPNIAGLLDSFVGEESNPLRVDGGYLTLDKDFVLNLVREYSYYYSPTVRPVFDFISEATDGFDELACNYLDEDGNVIFTAEEVQKFAYARYYEKVHGANIASVLIGENVGEVTMNFSGYPADTCAFKLADLYQLEADLSYIPDLYPVFAARRYLYVFAAVIALSIILFYQFGKREDDIINEIVVARGGTK